MSSPSAIATRPTPALFRRRAGRVRASAAAQARAARRHRARRRDGPGRRRPARPHDARPRAAARRISAEIEKGAMAKSGEPVVVNARPAAQAWDGQRLPGPWLTLRALDAAIAMAQDVRHRHRRHPPLAPHRLPRRVPEARDRSRHDGAHLLLGSVDEERGAIRRRVVGVHAQSVRRGHSDLRRPDPARHLGELHDQRPDRAPAQGRRETRRIRGCRMRRATRRTIPPCCSTSPRARCCRSAGSRRDTRATRWRCWSRR